jgi:hypothetical protein
MKDARERHKNAGAPRQGRAAAYFCVPFILFLFFGEAKKRKASTLAQYGPQKLN